MPAHVCEFHDDEVGFVAAIPLDLLAELCQQGSIHVEILRLMLAPMGSFEAHVRASDECEERMLRHLLNRVYRVRKCLNTKGVIRLANSPTRDEHVRTCQRCKSKLGWANAKLSFREEFQDMPKS